RPPPRAKRSTRRPPGSCSASSASVQAGVFALLGQARKLSRSRHAGLRVPPVEPRRRMTRRLRLFPKYALLIITLVGSMLVASGAIGLYFSWRESKANLDALQQEKAENAATRIEKYILDIEHQL